MRELLVILGLIIAAIALGTLLFFFGPASFRSALSGNHTPGVAFRVLKVGQNASGMTDRANYSIQNGTQLNQLWSYLDPSPQAAPNVDFTKEDVLAVFDGSHTKGGYNIQITSIIDANGTRTVNVSRSTPGANCVTTSGFTSPYEVIAVPKSALPLAHVDTSVTQDCP